MFFAETIAFDLRLCRILEIQKLWSISVGLPLSLNFRLFLKSKFSSFAETGFGIGSNLFHPSMSDDDIQFAARKFVLAYDDWHAKK